jgi:hypothetical protein
MHGRRETSGRIVFCSLDCLRDFFRAGIAPHSSDCASRRRRGMFFSFGTLFLRKSGDVHLGVWLLSPIWIYLFLYYLPLDRVGLASGTCIATKFLE